MMIKGLKEDEVLELRKKYGENTLPAKEGYSWLSILLAQFKSPLIYILLFAAAVSFSFKEYTDIALICFVIIVNVIMGFYQEYNAQKTLAALRKILKPKTIVIREGKRKEIEAKELVPGDFVVLGGGDRVPADGKLIEGANLLVNEAILTGEEEAVAKTPAEEDNNSLFMGATVISGAGIMSVKKIGSQTEIGKIGKSLMEIKEGKTPLQVSLEKFAKSLAYLVAGVCGAIFVIGVLHHENPWEMLRIAVVLSVAAIPEGLPIAITVILALGMRRILKRNGLVKKLLSIETLGSTSVICVDKTGTLTEGVMRAVKADLTDHKMAAFALILATNQRTNLEVALWNFIKEDGKLNPQEVFDSNPRIYDEPFDSEKKYAMTINKIEGRDVAFILGAPEIILSFCGVSAGEWRVIAAEIDDWAGRGLRIIGAAFKEQGDLKEKKNFVWLGLVGIEDPVRAGVKESIAEAQEAGIKIKIVTGDYRKTAEKVAQNLGLDVKPENVIEGKELEEISETELSNRVENLSLFARVSPHQKLKIVTALQKKGEIVAMTGDGVNDAPALKKANIGVAVGSATDVAKEVGDLILLDNNFKTIVAAIEEGRLIFSNIKKVVGYVLSNSFAEIILIFGAMLLDFPAPLIVVQILWMHLICDGPPDIVLSFEPKEREIMRESPKALRREEVLSNAMKLLIAVISISSGLLALLFFWFFRRETGDLNLARTIAFSIVASDNLIYIFAFKNLKKPIFRTEKFFQNKYLFGSVIYGLVLIFAAVYLPALNKILGTVPLSWTQWWPALSVALLSTLCVELVKAVGVFRTKTVRG